MDDERLAERFEGNRARLRAMAYRMLGAASDADMMITDTGAPAEAVESLRAAGLEVRCV